MLERLGQIVTVAEVKVAVQIDICEHSKVSLFQWMCLFNRWLTYSYQYCIFDCVNNVLSNDAAFGALRNQNHVIALHKSNETQHSVGADFLFEK